jgi:hypothetical protein
MEAMRNILRSGLRVRRKTPRLRRRQCPVKTAAP